METLRNNTYNLLALAAAVIAATVAIVYAPYEDGTGMALLVLMWVPLVIGLITVAFYFLVRRLAAKSAWIITALGVAFLLAITASALWA
ncbi:hypothetical protein [Lewinella sp. 4G2]|uniref:hypothetical protein n=1 Tax=Lewinella sp. 4G2 TaxID=1803372 RepID=UPI0007B4D025|nr:hypothetical protein [Lewinella sp. 4G2]OAV45705.1 hypothetical protein A3850_014925 [Lewinella sp. 4G2]